MHIKDFFRVLIRIFGIYFLLQSLISQVEYIVKGYDFLGLAVTSWQVLKLIFVDAVIIYVVLQPDRLIGLLRLEKGYNADRIEFGTHATTNLFKMCLVVIGMYLFFGTAPWFIVQLIALFNEEIAHSEYYVSPGLDMFGNGITILFGLLLFTKSDWLTRFFIRDGNREDSGN